MPAQAAAPVQSAAMPAIETQPAVQQQAPLPPKQEAIPQPATPPPAGRRLSMNLLTDLDEAVNNAAANHDSGPKELSLTIANQLFEEYKQQLLAAGKNVIYSQFCLMRVEVLPPDELRVISPSELTDTYVREQRNMLIDFYREQTKMIVRITTEIQEDEAVLTAQQPKVLSKSEMYDAMAQKNPNLARLKEGLGLQVEY